MTPAVGRRELTLVLLWAVLVMAVTCLPYLDALRVAEGRVFGGFLWGVDEGNVYLAWIRQAAEGEWFLRNQYCLAPENPRFVNLYFQLAGRLSALTGLSGPVVFHALRLAGGVFLLWSLYLLTASVTRNLVARWMTLGLASFGSGLGWLAVLTDGAGGLRPVDVGLDWQVQPEAVTFPSLLLNGLFVTAMGLMCQVLRLSARAVTENSGRAAVASGLLLLILGNIHTYNVFAVHLALVLWLAARLWSGTAHWGVVVRHYATIVAISVPSVIWAVYAAKADPAFMAKGLTPTPAFRFLDYAAGYGLIGLLALGGAIFALLPRLRQVGHDAAVSTLPICWALGNSLVLLIPVSFQRKMVEGLHLPLCILAGVAVAGLTEWLTRGLRRSGRLREAKERTALTVVAVGVACMPSNAFFVAQCLGQVRNNNANLARVLQPPLFLDNGEAKALAWLGQNTTPDDVVLSSSFAGSYLPTYGPGRPWVGHWAETLALVDSGHYVPPHAPLRTWERLGRDPGVRLARFGDNLALVDTAFRPTSGEDLLRLLREYPVTMVYYGPWEQAMTAGGHESGELGVAAWKAAASKVLQVVYDSGPVTIYRVPRWSGGAR